MSASAASRVGGHPACPSWCERERGHDAGERFCSHWSPAASAPVETPRAVAPLMPEDVIAEPSSHEAELARVDGPDGVGETVIVVDDQGDAPLSLEAARAFGLALLSLADEGEATR